VFDAPTPVRTVQVCTGMCTFDAFARGNAPSKLSLQFSDGSTQAIEITKMGPVPQDYPLRPVTTSSVKVRVDAIRKGTEFNDACLSELTFLR
jgi:hypothetical protein